MADLDLVDDDEVFSVLSKDAALLVADVDTGATGPFFFCLVLKIT